jgi:hypothetical protein
MENFMNPILQQENHTVGYVHFNPTFKKKDPSLSEAVSDLTQELVMLKKKTMKMNRSNLSVTMWSQDAISFR